ncbi:MAG: PKD domain-containing protein, partial [Owenweeksia sp.]
MINRLFSGYFLVLSILLLCSQPLLLKSQQCIIPPQQLVNGNFDLPVSSIPTNDNHIINNVMPGWFVSHGSPTTQAVPNRSMWMWSYSSIGEGVFNCYDFQPGEQYRICFDLKTNGWGDSSLVNVMAANGLNTSGSTSIPTPSTSTPIWQGLASNYNPWGWTQITTVFTPSSNFSQIWFYPFWDASNGANQVEMTIDNVSIEHIGAGNYTANPSSATICPTQSVQLNASGGQAYSWSPATGLSCTNCPNPVASPLTTTTYNVNIMDYRDCELVANPRQVTITVLGCSVNSDFTFTTQICNDVQFNQTSTPGQCSQITGWYWDFGDNTSSTLPNPLHTYASPGSYNVCLTTIAYDGNQTCTSKKCYTVVAGYCEVNANYSYSYLDNCTDVQFTDLSTPGPCSQIVGWYWDFGDGTTSNQQSPLHTFPGSGTYNVCLYTFGDNGYISCIDDICMLVDVGEPCNIKTDLAYYQPGQGYGTCMDLQFFDMSVVGRCTYLSGWYWDFGDGTTSNQPNPLHTFPGAGTYTVCLTTFAHDGNISCFDDTCYTVVIDPSCSVESKFFYTVNSSTCDFRFTDYSEGNSCTNITGWYWDFGDGHTSNQQNPTHHFFPGTYNVCLTTFGDNGFVGCYDDTCLTVTIDPCSVTPDFNFTTNSCNVQFNDLTTFGPCTTPFQWHWDFGDGTTSNLQSPSHTYAGSGTYNVCLTAYGDDGHMI